MAVVPPFPSSNKVKSWARSESTVFPPRPTSWCKSPRSSQQLPQSLKSEAKAAQYTNDTKVRKMSHHNGSSAAMDHHNVVARKERRDSNAMLKRSYSTPAVKTMSSSVVSDQVSGEKKRNKLGYHRTSIACTHCRRRKIRCIVSTDMENSCINCVRLKKDCSFQPVDQPFPPPSEHRKDSIQGQPIVPILASNSPALAIGGVNLPNGSVQEEFRSARMPSQSRSIPVFMSDGSAGFSTDLEASGLSNQTGTPWTSPAAATATMSNANDMAVMWQQMESPAADSFSSLDPGSTGVPTWSTGASGSVSVSGDDWAWTSSVPSTARSMSFSGDFLPGQSSQITSSQDLGPGATGYSQLFPHPINATAIHESVMHMDAGLQSPPGFVGQAAWGPEAFRKPGVDFGNWQFPTSEDGTHL